MKKIFNYFLLISLVALTVYAVWKFYSALTQSSAQTVAAIIGGMLTVIGGISAVIITQKQTKQREIDSAHRERKIEIYKYFMDMVTHVMASQNQNLTVEPISTQELADKMMKFQGDILLWGSPKVIKTYLNFKALLGGSDGTKMLVATNEIYKAMREDVGLSNADLNNNEFIKIFLSDPNELDTEIEK